MREYKNRYFDKDLHQPIVRVKKKNNDKK